MTHLCFIDETGTDSSSTHYSIGSLIYPLDFNSKFLKIVDRIKSKHHFMHEIKWSKTHKACNLINTGLCLFYEALTNEMVHYHCITVNKSLYNNWKTSTKEQAFYTTLIQLITKSAKFINDNLIITCDARNDSYDKHHEVCHIISNYMLKKDAFAEVREIKTCDSKACDGIQVADYITGAINASHQYCCNNTVNIHHGKLKCIELMSKILGWNNLAWDTWPNDKFNIWNFPKEYRADQGKSKDIEIKNLTAPTYLTRDI